MMETDDWSSSGEGLSDCDPCFEDTQDEELIYVSGSLRKLQIRKDASKAHWNNTIGKAEIVEIKGRMLTSMGIVRNGKIYCWIEEASFLAEVGALVIVDDEGASLPLKGMYEMIAEAQSGCNWEEFQVYRHLKSLGYIVGRHGIPWSLKSIKSKANSANQPLEDDKVVVNECKEEAEEQIIVDRFSELQIGEGKLVFDVYLPNSKFRKSLPGDPIFIVCLARSHTPSTEEIEDLERQCKDIPLRFANVEHGRVTFFSFNKVELDVLP